MSLPTPNLDDRRFDDLVEEAKQKIQERCPTWTDFNASDPGIMLVELMAWMTESTSYRLNRVPEKHFVKFLELMGVTLTPAQPAKAWVVFTIKQAAKEENVGTIPVGTSLVSSQEQGDPCSFVTTHHLNLTTAKITRIVSAHEDRYDDHLAGLDIKEVNNPPVSLTQPGLPLFRGIQPKEHCLYLGDARFGEYADGTRLKVEVQLFGNEETGGFIEWEVLSGKEWVPVIPQQDDSVGFRQSGTILFDQMPVKEESLVNEITSFWLRARLVALRGTSVPKFLSINRAIELKEGGSLPLDKCILNAEREPTEKVPLVILYKEVDLAKEFFLFGNSPKTGDIVYLRSHLFEMNNAQIFLQVQLAAAYSPLSQGDFRNLEIHWEYYSEAQEWVLLGISTAGGVTRTDYNFSDDTKAFTQNGTIQFDRPRDASPFTLQADQGWYIRARIVRGNYGDSASTAPLLSSLRVRFAQHAQPWTHLLSNNDGQFVNVQEEGRQIPSLKPFILNPDTNPSVYIALDHPLSNKSHRLYFRLHDQTDRGSRTLVWEYEVTGGWSPLVMHEDGTEGLTQSGALEFLVPSDWVQGNRFKGEGYWLRTRWIMGVVPSPTLLNGVYLNAAEVIQAQAYTDEPLGSSTGNPFQTFRFPHSSLQPNQRIIVKEIVNPSSEQIQEYRELFHDEPKVNTSTGTITELWMPWSAVQNFLYSNQDSRHYMMNLESGTITFGDGRRGKIPSIGTNNIKAECYFVSQGGRGNVGKGQISTLPNSVPYVEAVINPDPATGGIEQETIEEAKLRGPWLLKHRDRAVTQEDFEELAKIASREVAIARCLSSRHGIQVLIVPKSDRGKPMPSNQLIQTVTNYLNERRLLTTQLQVIGPVYVDMKITLKLVLCTNLGGKESLMPKKIEQRLQAFFHPFLGGQNGEGWPMGRAVYISELYYAIEQTEGVDHVTQLKLYEWSTHTSTDRVLIPSHGFPYLRQIRTELISQA